MFHPLRRPAWTLAAVFLCLFAAACGEQPSSTPSASSGEEGSSSAAPTASRGVIGLSVLTTTNPFFNVIAESMKAEAAKHGYEVLVVSGEFDVARQQNQVKDFIVRKCVAIVLCPCDSRSIVPAIHEAHNAGIPVFTADIAVMDDTAPVTAHIATDNLQGGRLAGEAMIEALGEQGGKVVILDFRQAESCIMRVRGFKEVIAAHNAATGSEVIRIVAELPGDGMKDKGYRMTEDALQAHPDLAGIFAINDPSALGAIGALQNAGKMDQVKIIAFDGQPEGKEAIRDGLIYADPIQFPDQIGIKTVQAIVRYLEGEPVDKQLLIPTQLYRKEDALRDPEIN